MINARFVAPAIAYLKRNYSLDARALSLMRVCLGLVLLLDLCIRAGSLTGHYTAEGAVPFDMLKAGFWKAGYFSLFQFSDTEGFAILMFVLTGLVYVGFLLGYKTQIFSALSWFMLTSLQNRNTIILQGGDDLLRLLLFWGIFLPWGRYYSLDARRKKQIITEKAVFSVAGAGYVLLIASVYFFTGILKSGEEWTTNGNAMYYAFSLDQVSWPLGKWLLQFPVFLQYLTLFVRWVEVLIPVLLFIPYKNGTFRLLFIVFLTVFQLCISATLFVGLFFIINIVSLIGLLPSYAMDKLEMRFNKLLASNETQNAGQKEENYYVRVLKNSALFFVMALCMLWNLGSLPGRTLRVSDDFQRVIYTLRLDQNWAMFAPTVFKDDGWFVMEGTLADSSKIDMNRNGLPVNYVKPARVLDYIKDDRWRKYQENVLFIDNNFIRPYYCNYLLRNWNGEHPDRNIIHLDIIYMKEISLPPGQIPVPKREVLCSCSTAL